MILSYRSLIERQSGWMYRKALLRRIYHYPHHLVMSLSRAVSQLSVKRRVTWLSERCTRTRPTTSKWEYKHSRNLIRQFISEICRCYCESCAIVTVVRLEYFKCCCPVLCDMNAFFKLSYLRTCSLKCFSLRNLVLTFVFFTVFIVNRALTLEPYICINVKIYSEINL